MNILVTGAKGFVGRELVKELKKQKHKVVEFDLYNGQNILNKEDVKRAMKNIDIVIHLAAIIKNNSKDLWKVNVEGTKNLIEESVNARINKFILLSSTGVYGTTNKIVDEDSETSPETLYDKSKVEAEQIVLNRQEEIQVNVLRSAMVFGANEYWGRMFRILKKNIPLPCSGKNIFQVIYVKELIRAILVVMEKGEPGEIYLVSGKEKWTLKDFCKKTKNLMGLSEKIISLPEIIALILGKILKIKIITKENIHHLKKNRKYSPKKINKLGYEQKYSLEEAIKETIKDLRENEIK